MGFVGRIRDQAGLTAVAVILGVLGAAAAAAGVIYILEVAGNDPPADADTFESWSVDEHPDFEWQSRHIDSAVFDALPDPGTADVAPLGTATLTGTVFYEDTGGPAAGALLSAHFVASDEYATSVAGADGSYTFQNVPLGGIQVAALGPGTTAGHRGGIAGILTTQDAVVEIDIPLYPDPAGPGASPLPAGQAAVAANTWTLTGTIGDFCSDAAAFSVSTPTFYTAVVLNTDQLPYLESDQFDVSGIPIGEPVMYSLTDPGRLVGWSPPIDPSAGSVVQVDIQLLPCSTPPAGVTNTTASTTTTATVPGGQAGTTSTTESDALPYGSLDTTPTTSTSQPTTLGDGYYLVPDEILPGLWTFSGSGCGWVKMNPDGSEATKGETDVTVADADHRVRLLGGCTWTFQG